MVFFHHFRRRHRGDALAGDRVAVGGFVILLMSFLLHGLPACPAGFLFYSPLPVILAASMVIAGSPRM